MPPRSIGLVVVAALWLSSQGCSDGASAPDPAVALPAVTSAEHSGLRVTLALEPATLMPDGELTARVTITNTAARMRVLSFRCASLVESIEVRALPPSTVRYSTPAGCFTALTGATLGPGESRSIEALVLARDLREPERSRPLAPGSYMVESRLSLRGIDGESVSLAPVQAGFRVR